MAAKNHHFSEKQLQDSPQSSEPVSPENIDRSSSFVSSHSELSLSSLEGRSKVKFDLVLASGTLVNLLNKETWLKILSNDDVKKVVKVQEIVDENDKNISTFTGKLTAKKILWLPLQVSRCEASTDCLDNSSAFIWAGFYCVEEDIPHNLLGLPFLQKHECTLDLQASKLKFSKDSIEYYINVSLVPVDSHDRGVIQRIAATVSEIICTDGSTPLIKEPFAEAENGHVILKDLSAGLVDIFCKGIPLVFATEMNCNILISFLAQKFDEPSKGCYQEFYGCLPTSHIDILNIKELPLPEPISRLGEVQFLCFPTCANTNYRVSAIGLKTLQDLQAVLRFSSTGIDIKQDSFPYTLQVTFGHGNAEIQTFRPQVAYGIIRDVADE